MKKNTLIWVAAGAVAIYFLMQKRRQRGTVTVEDAEIISQREFEEAKPAESPLQKVTEIVSTLFPKRTTEQKRTAKAARMAKRAGRKAGQAARQALGSFDNVLY